MPQCSMTSVVSTRDGEDWVLYPVPARMARRLCWRAPWPVVFRAVHAALPFVLVLLSVGGMPLPDVVVPWRHTAGRRRLLSQSEKSWLTHLCPTCCNALYVFSTFPCRISIGSLPVVCPRCGVWAVDVLSPRGTAVDIFLPRPLHCVVLANVHCVSACAWVCRPIAWRQCCRVVRHGGLAFSGRRAAGRRQHLACHACLVLVPGPAVGLGV